MGLFIGVPHMDMMLRDKKPPSLQAQDEDNNEGADHPTQGQGHGHGLAPCYGHGNDNDNRGNGDYTHVVNASGYYQPFMMAGNHTMKQTTTPQESTLPRPIQVLFFFNGATEALPMIALSSLVNDRIAVPVSLLPAYYAISFLPYSLKPFYAVITTFMTSTSTSTLESESESSWSTCTKFSNHAILVILLMLSSIMIFIKACLKQGQVLMLFLSSFGRSVCVSWAELLVGLSLIAAAKQAALLDQLKESELELEQRDMNMVLGDDGENDGNVDMGMDTDMDAASRVQKRQEVYLSLYQSQAATCRNGGSLTAALVTFVVLFISSHAHANKNDNDSSSSSAISDGMVTFILIGTASIPAMAAVVASVSQLGKRSGYIDMMGKTPSMKIQDHQQQPHQTQRQQRRRHQRNGHGYGRVSVSPTNENESSSTHTSNVSGHNTMAAIGGDTRASTSSSSLLPHPLQVGTQEKLHILSVILFQSLLVMIGLRSILVSYSSNKTWNITFASLVFGLLWTMFLTHHWNEDSRNAPLSSPPPLSHDVQHDDHNRHHHHHHSQKSSQPSTSLLARVGGYLILRHSIPSTSLVSSYTYGIFRSNALYLQTMNLLSSLMAVLSSWTYTKTIAAKCSSMGGIQKVIIVSTIVCALLSCLSIVFIHEFRKYGNGGNDCNGGDGEDDNIGDGEEEDHHGDIFENGGMWLIALYSVYTLMEGFLAEVNFLPSVVLATNTLAWNKNDALRTTMNGNDGRDGNDNGIESQFDCHHQSRCTSTATATTITACIGSSECPNGNSSLLSNDGIHYGMLIACIDFGDQASEFLSMPLIEMLDIQRDNDWQNLEWYVLVCAILSVLSLFFLMMLRPFK